MSPGRAWIFGDDLDTDALAPSAYLMQAPSAAVQHCLENHSPEFAAQVKGGDIFVAGENLGIGSSREQAPFNLMELGIRFILAKSFARIFYRNALNLGIPTLVCQGVDQISDGDSLEVDPCGGVVHNTTTGVDIPCEPLPPHLMEMIEAGGLIQHLKKKLAAQHKDSQ